MVERGLQYGLGRGFSERPNLDEFTEKVLTQLPDLESYPPLAMPASFETKTAGGLVSELTVRGNRKTRTLTVLPDLTSFQDYCEKKRVRGMIFVVPELVLEKIPPSSFVVLQSLFENIGKVVNPDIYRVWFVEEKVAAESISGSSIEVKKQLIGQMGLCGVKYHHPRGSDISWFVSRPYKKRQTAEKDISGDERIRFLQEWMGYVIEYRGGKVISTAELTEKLKHSKSKYMDMQKIGDGRGILSEEACGCLIQTDLRGESNIVCGCDGEKCFKDQKSRDSKKPFRLGEEKKVRCADCGNSAAAVAYWVETKRFDPQKGMPVNYKLICSQFDSHSNKGLSWVDPARILNPLYIYNCLHSKNKDKKAV